MNAATHCGSDPLVLERIAATLTIECTLSQLERQPQLAAPAKLALCGRGDAELLVEISRGLDTRLALAAAETALGHARAWLEGAPIPPGSDAVRAAIEEALCELDWSFEPQADGALHARLPGAETAALQIEASAGEQLRVSHELLLPLRGAEPEILARFALESNRRLRFARLSLVPAEAGHVRAVWDAVLGMHPCAPDALRDAARAVLYARELTAGGLRALRHASVRQAFQRLRTASA